MHPSDSHSADFEALLHAGPPLEGVANEPASDDEVRFLRGLGLAYLALLVYGSLFPSSGQAIPRLDLPGQSIGSLLFGSLFAPQSATDVIFNLLIYIPFGLMLVRAMGVPRPGGALIGFAALTGFTLSLGLEATQSFIPGRSPSLVDVMTNTSGAAIGGLIGTLPGIPSDLHDRLDRWRADNLKSGAVPALGAVVLVVWVLSQLSPFIPGPSVTNIKHGFAPIWHTLTGHRPFAFSQWLEYAAALFAMAVIGRHIMRDGAAPKPLYLALGAVLLLKVPIVDRQLGMESSLGWVAGMIACHRLINHSRARTYAGAAILLAAAIERLRPGSGTTLHPMDWIPFRGQMGALSGLADLADACWPYMALAFLLIYTRERHAERRWVPFFKPMLKGAVLVFGFAFLLELIQTQVPGRYPDITDPVMAVAAWLLPWLHPTVRAAIARHPSPTAADKATAKTTAKTA